MSKPDFKGFARWCLQNGPWDGCDLDGCDVQDAALKFGIVEEVKYDPTVHGETECDVCPGDPWYVMVEDKRS